MTYAINAGLAVSIDYNPSTGLGTWYPLTDHNRQPIQYSLYFFCKCCLEPS